MKSAGLVFVLHVVLAVTGSFSAETASCGSKSTWARPQVKCRIAPKGSLCYSVDTDEGRVDECDDRAPCRAWTGAKLQISCSEDDPPLTLYRGNSTFVLDTLPFTTSSATEGVYECRSVNGSLVANRFVTVDSELLMQKNHT